MAGQSGRSLHALELLIAGTPYADYARVATTAPSGQGVADVHNLVTISRFPIHVHREVRHQFVASPCYQLKTAVPPELQARPVTFDRPILVADIELPGGDSLTVVNVHLRAPLCEGVLGVGLQPEPVGDYASFDPTRFAWNHVRYGLGVTHGRQIRNLEETTPDEFVVYTSHPGVTSLLAALCFAVVGGPYQIGSIVSAIVLTILVRRSVTFRWTLAGTLLLIAAFVSWLILVLPVNREVAAALDASPQTVPSLWMQLRDRWEYGHATGFVLHLAGFCALVASVVRDTRTVR